jgi:TPR repeat protein
MLALACLFDASSVRAEANSGLRYFQAGQFAEAFENWSRSAMSGDASSALYVGVLYDTGLGVRQDFVQAREWYRRAADNGNAVAMFNLAVMYDSGRGGPPDLESAAYWYTKAAEKRFGRAEYNLATMYEAGLGVARDRGRAIRLYRAAARDGIAAAAKRLIHLGLPHPGAETQSQDIAMRDFQKAQQILLTRGPTEAAEATALMQRAAEEGNPLAEYDLGYCYDAQAIAWYRRAASQAGNAAVSAIAEAGERNLQAQTSQAQR